MDPADFRYAGDSAAKGVAKLLDRHKRSWPWACGSITVHRRNKKKSGYEETVVGRNLQNAHSRFHSAAHISLRGPLRSAVSYAPCKLIAF